MNPTNECAPHRIAIISVGLGVFGCKALRAPYPGCRWRITTASLTWRRRRSGTLSQLVLRATDRVPAAGSRRDKERKSGAAQVQYTTASYRTEYNTQNTRQSPPARILRPAAPWATT
eukprot:358445-Chlamydomonas_euryale.AAC.26